MVKITLLWVLGVAAFGAWLLSFYLTPGRRVIPRSPTFVLAIVLLAVTSLATIFSTNRTLSFFGLYQRYEGLASLVLYVGIGGLISLLYYERPDALRDFALAIGAASGVLALYVIVQHMGRDPFHWQFNGVTPVHPIGSLGNSDFASAYMGIGAPFLLYLVISHRSLRWRAGWSIVAGVSLIAIWFTQGRGGMLAAIAGVLAFVLLTRRTSAARKVTVIAVALVFLALVPLIASRSAQLGGQGVLRTSTVSYRQQMWTAGLQMTRARPIFGWGPETYYGIYPRFRESADARIQELLIPDKPHNIFVNWAASTGIVGLLTYLTLAGSALWLVAERGPRLTRSGELLAATYGAGFVAYLAQGIFSIDVPPLALMGWVALGAIGAVVDASAPPEQTAGTDAATQRRATAQHRPNTSSWFRESLIPPTAVGVVLVVMMIRGLGPLRADHAARAAGQQPWNAMALYEKAIRLNPQEAAYKSLEASYLEQVANDPSSLMGSANALRQSAAQWERAADIQPGNLTFLLGAARVFARLGSTVDPTFFASGDHWLARAVYLDGRDPEVHGIYADFLRQWAPKAGTPSDRRELERRAQQETATALSLQTAP